MITKQTIIFATSATAISLILLVSTACGVPPISAYRIPIELGTARSVMPQESATIPPSKVYRQYVSGNFYLQFERMEEKVIYGYLACTDCDWQRIPITSIYDGSYFYVAIGRQDDFYTSPNEGESINPAPEVNPDQSAVLKGILEGRNIIIQQTLVVCDYGEPEWQEKVDGKSWGTEEYWEDWAENCNEPGERSVKTVYVATTDDFVGGEKRSVVEDSESKEQSGGKLEKLRQLKKMLDEELITEKEFAAEKKKILEE